MFAAVGSLSPTPKRNTIMRTILRRLVLCTMQVTIGDPWPENAAVQRTPQSTRTNQTQRIQRHSDRRRKGGIHARRRPRKREGKGNRRDDQR